MQVNSVTPPYLLAASRDERMKKDEICSGQQQHSVWERSITYSDHVVYKKIETLPSLISSYVPGDKGKVEFC